MDFVVIGLGLSALALLTGLALLCLVAPRWFRKAGVAQPGDAAYARAQAGERHALGQGFLCVGGVMLLATLGGISAGLADKAGAYLIASITTVAVLGLFGWDLLYRRQHPIPPRRRVVKAQAKPEADAASALSPAAPATGSPGRATTSARRRVLPARQRVVTGAQPAATPPAHVGEAVTRGDEQPQADAGQPSSHVAETIAAASEVAPGLEVFEPAGEGSTQDDSPSHLADEVEPVEPAPIEPPEIAAVLPDPVPFPAKTNGSGEPTVSLAPSEEPELAPSGDDRVIALFPTAAARRARPIITPTDSDGQS